MLPKVIGGPGGCFAFAMPGAYPQDISRAILSQHPRRLSPSDFRERRAVLGATRRDDTPVAPLAKVQHQRRTSNRAARRAVLRGVSECANSLASDFNEPDYY